MSANLENSSGHRTRKSQCSFHTISVLYCAHLCMKYSLSISNFLEEISGLSHSFPLFLYIIHLKMLSYLSLLFFGMDFSDSSVSKESACKAGDLRSTPLLGRSHGRESGNPLQYSCLKNPHGQRILVA